MIIADQFNRDTEASVPEDIAVIASQWDVAPDALRAAITQRKSYSVVVPRRNYVSEMAASACVLVRLDTNGQDFYIADRSSRGARVSHYVFNGVVFEENTLSSAEIGEFERHFIPAIGENVWFPAPEGVATAELLRD